MSLTDEYKPAVVVYVDADVMEYVNSDVASVYDYVDENLSIIRNMQSGEIIGVAISNWRQMNARRPDRRR